VRQRVRFDPYATFEALEQRKVGYVVIGGFARVVHGSGELTRGLDIVPSLRESDLRRLGQALDELKGKRNGAVQLTPEALTQEERTAIATSAGALALVPIPWGTRGYDDLRIRANRENLGRGLRPRIASVVDLVRMLEASQRALDQERLRRLRRMLELERQRGRRGLQIER
jgi:hypothetical protein